jgi:hypothetical protein
MADDRLTPGVGRGVDWKVPRHCLDIIVTTDHIHIEPVARNDGLPRH